MFTFINIVLSFSQNLGYSGIVLLMAIESSFIPFPSEIIIPPAAYLASQGQMNIILVIVAGIVGSLIGRLIPVIRQLISLPAGFARMNFKSFVFYTTLGSSVWVIFLAISSYIL